MGKRSEHNPGHEVGETGGPSRSVGLPVGLPIWLLVGGATVLGTALPVALHYGEHGVVNGHQIALAFFFWLNVIIAFWEICLFLHIDLIRRQYEGFVRDYRGRELDRVIELFTSKVPLGRALATETWAEIWSSYSLFDESYADKRSFGYFIDIGNGFTTLVPSLLFAYGMTFQILPARVLGIIGLVFSYQMLYGTLVYFSSFILNKRFRGHRPFDLAIFVGLSNGLWTVFPIWAIGASIWMIYNDSYALFGV